MYWAAVFLSCVAKVFSPLYAKVEETILLQCVVYLIVGYVIKLWFIIAFNEVMKIADILVTDIKHYLHYN